MFILPKVTNGKKWDIIASELCSAMPTETGEERVPQVGDMLGVLNSLGWTLVPVGMRYRAEGHFLNLMQEKKCRVIVNIKLTNHEGETWRHFVAWDGSIIHDHPCNCKVNKISDRTKKGSRILFKKCFPKEEFKEAQVCSVFELQRCPLKIVKG